jgi:hypothetical protein
MPPSQVFTNEGLSWFFNQFYIGGTPTTPAYEVGLFTGDLPSASTTITTLSEVAGEGYSRLSVTFGAPVVASVSTNTTNLSTQANAGDWTVTLDSVLDCQVGMTIHLGGTTRIVTGVLSGNVVVLNQPLVESIASGGGVSYGDAVNGMKVVGTSANFYARGTWDTANGYFVSDSVGNRLLFAAQFADGSTPILTATDTLVVTPIWLMGN